MSIFDGLGGILRGDKRRAPWDLSGIQPQSAKAAYDQLRVGIKGRPQYPTVDTESLLTAYQRNEMVYAAIDIKASAAIDPRLIVQDRTKDGGWKETDGGHPLRRLMMKPNEYMDEAGLLRAYIVSLDTVGRFVCEIVRGGNGLPIELHPLNPTKIAPIPGDRGIDAWLFRDGNYQEEIPAENVLVRSLWNPASRWNSLSPLAVAMGSVDADIAQTDYTRAFFNNAGVPSGILTVKGRKLTQLQADEVKAKWMDKYNRAWGRQHDVAVLDEDASYQRVGANLNEIESEALRSFTESRIAMVFKVPPLIIYSYTGLLRATYSNLKEAWQGFGDYTLSPLLKEYRNWLLKTLLLEFVSEDLVLGERVRLGWDLSECAWTQEDINAIQLRARQNFASGGLTLNEFRAKIGELPDPAGDYYLRNAKSLAVDKGTPASEQLVAGTLATQAVDDTGGAATTGKSLQLKSGNPEEVKATRAGLEKKLALKLQRYLMKDFVRVAERVEKAA